MPSRSSEHRLADATATIGDLRAESDRLLGIVEMQAQQVKQADRSAATPAAEVVAVRLNPGPSGGRPAGYRRSGPSTRARSVALRG
jgi:hypothetical protein